MQSGLAWLQQQLPRHQPSHSEPLTPVFSLIQQLIESVRTFVQEEAAVTWAEYLLVHHRNGLRQTIDSWVEHNKHSLECQLLATLLVFPTTGQAKMYLRLRKHILKLTNQQTLEQIVLTHQDTITIIHRMFPVPQRHQLITGLKNIFIGYRVSDAKIYACVFVEYMLSIGAPSVQASQLPSQHITSANLSDFSSITNFNSAIHKENGLYRRHEHNDIPYKVIESKFTPKKMERKGTNFSGEEHAQHYYYSNSINYMEEQSGQNDGSEDKENVESQASEDVPPPVMSINEKKGKRKSQNIRIEEEGSQNGRSVALSNITNRSREYSQMMNRNADFKKRILTNKQGQKQKTEDSILEVANIIHMSIVHHAGGYFG